MSAAGRERRNEWWRGAVIYQIYPRSFQDSDGDGIGDLAGITRRLGHVASLGVDALWISPFFKSPMADFGYDIENHREVDPLFGRLEDFDLLLDEAHGLGLKLLVDLVPCHTSDRHAWFREARRSRHNPKADWYVFAEPRTDGTPPNNWLSVFGGAAWTFEPRRGQYYLHNFLASQPQLNWHNPEVRDAVLAEAEFWLERGVDGFRVDAVDFALHDELLRDNPARPPDRATPGGMVTGTPFARQMHVHQKSHPDLPSKVLRPLAALAARYDGAFLLGEISGDHGAERLGAYTDGGGLDAVYSFDLLNAEPSHSAIRAVIETIERHRGRGWACYALGNHDVPRAVSRFGPTTDAARWQPLLTALLGSLAGTVCLYQGEELALTEADLALEDLRDPYGIALFPAFKGRDGCRTPMPWQTDAPAAGFSTGEPWLPIPADHRGRAVDRQEADPASVLAFTRRFLYWRRRQPALLTGGLRLIDAPEPILALTRTHERQSVLCLFNLGATPARFVAATRFEPIDGHGFEAAVDGRTVRLPAFGAFFATLAQEDRMPSDRRNESRGAT